MDALATRVDSGMTSLDDKEQRLRALDRQAAESTSRIESLAADLRAAKVGVTEEQLDEHLAKTAAQLDSLAQRIDKLGSSVESGTASLTHNKQRLQDLDRRVTETGSRIESLTADARDAKAGVTKEELDDRLTEMKAALSAVGERIDELAAGVKSASTSHSNEEQKLEALHRQVSQSSSRIESIADDLRETLGAFPEATPDQLGELGARIDIVEKRVATVAAEVGRAKTLWPVALRSLEARLEDVTARSHETPEAATGHSTTAADQPADEADDLLAGLRDSLQAMESVAAEMEQAPEVDPTDDANDATPTAQQAIAGGARIVPLRSSDP